MKRILCLTILIMLQIPASSLATIPDIKSLSRSELLELNSMICSQLELKEDFDPFEVPIGFWTVGDNIPVGTYRISSKDGSMVAIDITENASKAFHEFVKKDVDLLFVELVAGAQVQIRMGSVMFSSADTIKFGHD